MYGRKWGNDGKQPGKASHEYNGVGGQNGKDVPDQLLFQGKPHQELYATELVNERCQKSQTDVDTDCKGR